MNQKAIIVSGYFNPLHKGHIELFHNAKSLADFLFVIVNNDYQRELKGSREFMKENERMLIINELEITDKVSGQSLIYSKKIHTVELYIGYGLSNLSGEMKTFASRSIIVTYAGATRYGNTSSKEFLFELKLALAIWQPAQSALLVVMSHQNKNSR